MFFILWNLNRATSHTQDVQLYCVVVYMYCVHKLFVLWKETAQMERKPHKSHELMFCSNFPIYHTLEQVPGWLTLGHSNHRTQAPQCDAIDSGQEKLLPFYINYQLARDRGYPEGQRSLFYTKDGAVHTFQLSLNSWQFMWLIHHSLHKYQFVSINLPWVCNGKPQPQLNSFIETDHNIGNFTTQTQEDGTHQCQWPTTVEHLSCLCVCGHGTRHHTKQTNKQHKSVRQDSEHNIPPQYDPHLFKLLCPSLYTRSWLFYIVVYSVKNSSLEQWTF